MKTMKIAITGPEQVGKSTLAENFEYYYQFKYTNFADSLKVVAKDRFPEINFGVGKSDEARKILCDISKEQRLLHQDDLYWTKKTMKEVEGFDKVVIGDLRFERELNVLLKEDFTIIWIGEYSDKYELSIIHKHVNLFVPKYPDFYQVAKIL